MRLSIVIGMIVAICACTPSPDRQAWDAAREANTVEAYNAFADAHPDSQLAPRARARIEILDWAHAQEIDTADGYAAFIQRHEGGAHAFTASHRLRERAWEDAVADGSPEALRAYLARWPDQGREEQAEIILAQHQLDAMLERYSALLEQARSMENWDATRSDVAPADQIARRNLLANIELAHGALNRHWIGIEWRTHELRAEDSPVRAEVESTLNELEFYVALAEAASGETGRSPLLALQAMLNAEDRAELHMRVAFALDQTIGSWANADDFQAYLDEFPNAGRAEAVRTALTRLAPRDLHELIEAGDIIARPTGGGVSSVVLTMTNTSSSALVARVPAGTVFVSAEGDVQNMISVASTSVALRPGEHQRIGAASACLNIRRRIPEQDDAFSLADEHEDTMIARIAAQLGDEAQPTRQAAIWILSDDATYAGLGVLVSTQTRVIQRGTATAAIPVPGQRRTIRPEHVERAVELLAEAGANVQAMRICASEGWERVACSG